MDVISGPQKREPRTPEFWHEVRQLVERGLSLKKVSQRFGLCWSSLVYRAQREDWNLRYRGRPRVPDYAQGKRRREPLAREQADYEAAQAALQREAGVLVIDVKKAELLTEKVLKGHSVRLKVALSEWAVRTAENLQRSEVRLRDQAAAMLAIKAIGNQLYGWDRESDLQRMARAVTSYADAEPAQTPTAAVNLALINTTPEQLAALAKENGYRDGQEVASPTEDNGLSMESSPVAPEQSRAAGGGWPSSEKEAPPLPVKQPGKSEPTASLRPVPTKQDSQSDPLPPAGHPASSTSVSESEARQKAFEQLRAEHRRACRLKYG